MYLYHYYDKRTGPFKSLPALSDADADRLLVQIRANRPESMCAKRDDSYVANRRRCEANDDGAHGPERYIEVHVWSDDVIRKYVTARN